MNTTRMSSLLSPSYTIRRPTLFEWVLNTMKSAVTVADQVWVQDRFRVHRWGRCNVSCSYSSAAHSCSHTLSLSSRNQPSQQPSSTAGSYCYGGVHHRVEGHHQRTPTQQPSTRANVAFFPLSQLRYRTSRRTIGSSRHSLSSALLVISLLSASVALLVSRAGTLC